MKTKPMAHQVVGCQKLAENPEFFGLSAEQGTGKTWMALADAERKFEAGEIDAVLIVAPKGVHSNWIRREIPAHVSVPTLCHAYAAGEGVRVQKIYARMRTTISKTLMFLAINYDALATKQGYKTASEFLDDHRCLMILDESHSIKSLKTKRTEVCISLGARAVSRRILTGTPIGNSPADAFSQFEFLKPEGRLLGTNSFVAFMNRYAEILPQDSYLVQQIKRRSPRAAFAQIQIVARDDNGNPQWRNLDELREKMAPYLYRVTKKDCLDLPDKVYQTIGFDLLPKQRALYDSVEKDFVLEVSREIDDANDKQAIKLNGLAKVTKLKQITSGFFISGNDREKFIEEIGENPRLELLFEVLGNLDGKVIIWSIFRAEIELIAKTLANEGVVTYYGGTSRNDRDAAIEAFQNGSAKYFVANPDVAGTGLTLTAATTAIYYSQNYSLIDRLQSEDRCHRIGTTSKVTYIDLVANDTVDEQIAAALQQKVELSQYLIERDGFKQIADRRLPNAPN